MSLHRLLPNSANKQVGSSLNSIVYLATTKWHWSFKQLQETPIPVILNNLKEYQKEQKEKAKANRKK